MKKFIFSIVAVLLLNSCKAQKVLPNGDTISLLKQIIVSNEYKLRIVQRIHKKDVDTLILYYDGGNLSLLENWNENNDLYHPIMDSVFDYKAYLIGQIVKRKTQ